jgi:hypothetical protein
MNPGNFAAVRAARAAALLAAIDATVTARINSAIDVERAHDTASTATDDERQALLQAQIAAGEECERVLGELADAATQYLTAMEVLPQNLVEASIQVALFAGRYEEAADAVGARVEAWRDLDVQTGRVRAGVVKRLMEVEGLSATAADKAASGDPEYTAHKDACAVALSEKELAERALTVATKRLDVAGLLLQGLVTLNTTRTRFTFATADAAQVAAMRARAEREGTQNVGLEGDGPQAPADPNAGTAPDAPGAPVGDEPAMVETPGDGGDGAPTGLPDGTTADVEGAAAPA